MTTGQEFERLVEIMHRLRAECPWDREQTHSSLKPYLIEEAYEVAEAIEDGSDQELCSELGDLLLQILFHSEVASETGRFAVADVIRSIGDKMVRRHPHVFGETEVSGSADVLRNWSRIKAEERREAGDRSVLAGVPRRMPALLHAQRLGEKAGNVGFDWPGAEGVLAKLREELAELAVAVERGDVSSAEAELGDLLLAATSLARHLGVNSEDTLKAAGDRFGRRFRRLEELLAERQRDIRETTPEEKEALWKEAKRQV